MHMFNTAGSFPYCCTVHGACCGMVGTVVVMSNPTPTPTPPPPPPGAGTAIVADFDGDGIETVSTACCDRSNCDLVSER